MEYLLFRLYGPMASWGEIAVGEMRHSDIKPSKSALVGLLGAALGLGRDDEENQSMLAASYRFAVRMHATGQLMRDYHTAQAPDSAGKFSYKTRRDELVVGRHRLGTVLSTREYRTDSMAIVALAAGTAAPWSLAKLKGALLKPRFHLYLGRKSCPLAAPLNPQIVQADGFLEAFEQYQPGDLLMDERPWCSDERWLPPDTVQHYYWEGSIEDFSSDGGQFDRTQVRELRRLDQPLSRQRWQFEPRKEFHWMKAMESR
ncbi:type I-E CRISPR-associated protein Cas5/CasD [Hahella sp. SMD15-11]|uniref:Type I-E CRISPR-associated protein Cas5/CasD n=1 Tax=Thermohahella caldifontis TaxID=3142973 RepID=A0AB39UV05_9GAMM